MYDNIQKNTIFSRRLTFLKKYTFITKKYMFYYITVETQLTIYIIFRSYPGSILAARSASSNTVVDCDDRSLCSCFFIGQLRTLCACPVQKEHCTGDSSLISNLDRFLARFFAVVLLFFCWLHPVAVFPHLLLEYL